MRKESDFEPESTGHESTSVTRRDVLKNSAIVATTGTLGIGMTGVVAASSNCTNEDRYLNERTGECWNKPYDHSNTECGGTNYDHKVNQAVNLQYWGTTSPSNEDRYFHRFETVGHSQSYSTSNGCDGWELNNTTGVLKQKATFYNDLTSNINNVMSTGSDVKANPAVGTNWVDETEDLDVAYAAIASGIDKVAWPAGTAMSIAAALVTNDDAAQKNNSTVEYVWDYGDGDYQPCATNGVYHVFRSQRGGDKHVKFTHYQEAWGDAGVSDIYIGTVWEIDMQDPKVGGCGTSSSQISSQECTGIQTEGGNETTPEVGDVIQTTEGDTVEVSNVNQGTSSLPGTAPKKLEASELGKQTAKRFGPDQIVEHQRLAANITRTTISGTVVK